MKADKGKSAAKKVAPKGTSSTSKSRTKPTAQAHAGKPRSFSDTLAIYRHNEVPSVLTLGYRYDRDW